MASVLGSAFSSALGGSAIGSAVVRLGLDTSAYNTQLAKARSETAAATGQMGSSAKGFSTIATAAFLVAGVAAIKFASSAVKSFEESQRVLQQLTLAVGENTAAYEAQAHAIQELTGYQDEEVLSADTVLSRFNLTERQIISLIPHVADYARATGVDVPTAAQNLGKALLGNTRALKTIGVAFTATGNTEKDLATITQALQDKVGGVAAAYGKTLPGQLAIAGASWDDFKEEIGKTITEMLVQLMPTLRQLIGVLHDTAPAIVRVIGLLGDMVELGLDPAGFFTRRFKDSTEELAQTISGPLADSLQQGVFYLRTHRDEVSATAEELVSQGRAFLSAIFPMREYGKRVSDTAARLKHFAEMSQADFRAWAAGTTASVDTVSSAFDELSSQAKVTTGEVLKSMRDQARAWTDYASNLQAVIDLNLPDELLKEIIDAGIGAASEVAALADANNKQVDRFVASWGRGQSAIARVAKEVTGLHRELDALPTSKQIAIEVDIHRNQLGIAGGGVIAGAAGFVTRRPTYLVGEGSYATAFGRGAEAVIPLNDATLSRLGKAIGKSSPTIVINGVIGGADEVRRQLEDLWRSRGW